jgi:hypothetical protein
MLFRKYFIIKNKKNRLIIITTETTSTPKEKKWEKIVSLLANIASLIAVVAVFIQCVILVRQNNIYEKMYTSETHHIVNEFLSQDMSNSREKCHRLREKICEDDEREKYVEKLKIIFKREIMGVHYDYNEWNKFLSDTTNMTLFNEYAALIRFFRFFEAISFHELSEENVKTVHFYYVWWRNFMFRIIKIYDEVWNDIESDPELRPYLSFKPPWADENKLIRNLDKKMKDYKLELE